MTKFQINKHGWCKMPPSLRFIYWVLFLIFSACFLSSFDKGLLQTIVMAKLFYLYGVVWWKYHYVLMYDTYLSYRKIGYSLNINYVDIAKIDNAHRPLKQKGKGKSNPYTHWIQFYDKNGEALGEIPSSTFVKFANEKAFMIDLLSRNEHIEITNKVKEYHFYLK